MNKPTPFKPFILIAGFGLLAAGLSSCGTSGGNGPAPVTPTERFTLEARPTTEQVALRPHPEGLSQNQVAALEALVQTYRATGGEALSVQAPAPTEEVATAAAWKVRDALTAMGVPASRIQVASYTAPGPGSPVLVAFTRYEAVVPQCGQRWDNLTATRNNATPSNFGCATSANMAAQIADPADIARLRSLDPADAGRRSTVLGKYRQGQPTATTPAPNADSRLSRAID